MRNRGIFVILVLLGCVSISFSYLFTEEQVYIENQYFFGNHPAGWTITDQWTGAGTSKCIKFTDDGFCSDPYEDFDEYYYGCKFSYNYPIAGMQYYFLAQDLDQEYEPDTYHIRYYLDNINVPFSPYAYEVNFGMWLYNASLNQMASCTNTVNDGNTYSGLISCDRATAYNLTHIKVRIGSNYEEWASSGYARGAIGYVQITRDIATPYEMNINYPEQGGNYSDLSIPVDVVTNRSDTEFIEYQLDTWDRSTWANLTYSHTDMNGFEHWTTDMYYLESGDYVLYIRDDLNNLLAADFSVDLISTPTDVNVDLYLEDKLVCSWDTMDLERGYQYQDYILEIWKDNVLYRTNTLTYPDELGEYGEPDTPTWWKWDEFSLGFEDEFYSDKLTYLMYYDTNLSIDTTDWVCRVAQHQYNFKLIGYGNDAFSNYGSDNQTIVNPYIKLFTSDLSKEYPKGFNNHDYDTYGDIVTFKFNTGDIVTGNYIIKHSNRNFYNEYTTPTGYSGVSYYNISLNYGRNYFQVFDNLNNYLDAEWRINMYDSVTINNVTLSDNYDNYICHSGTCNYVDLFERGVLEFNVTDDDRELWIKAYVVEGNISTLIYDDFVNTDQDFDGDDSVLSLFVMEEYGEGDQSMEDWLLRNPDVSPYLLDELDFVKKLNFEYIKEDEDNELRIYVPANRPVMVTGILRDTSKNITFTPKYSIYNNIKWSDLGNAIRSSCSLGYEVTGYYENGEPIRLTTWKNYATYYICLIDFSVRENLSTFTYIGGFLLIIFLGNTLLSVFKRR